METRGSYRSTCDQLKAYLVSNGAVNSGVDALLLLHRVRKIGNTMGLTPMEAIRLFKDIMLHKRPTQIDYFGLSMANIRAWFEATPASVDRNARYNAAIVTEIHAAYKRLFGV